MFFLKRYTSSNKLILFDWHLDKVALIYYSSWYLYWKILKEWKLMGKGRGKKKKVFKNQLIKAKYSENEWKNNKQSYSTSPWLFWANIKIEELLKKSVLAKIGSIPEAVLLSGNYRLGDRNECYGNLLGILNNFMEGA